jgi:hypothetical protein
MSIASEWAREWQMADLKRPRFTVLDPHGITVTVAEVTDDGTLAIRQVEMSTEQGAALGRWILDLYDNP